METPQLNTTVRAKRDIDQLQQIKTDWPIVPQGTQGTVTKAEKNVIIVKTDIGHLQYDNADEFFADFDLV